MNSWTKLEDGTWGVSLPDFYPTNLRAPGRDINAGMPATITSKSGEKKNVVLGDFVRQKHIQYKVTFGAGNEYIVTVQARDINAGFRKAVAEALKDVRADYDIHSVEFWMVV